MRFQKNCVYGCSCVGSLKACSKLTTLLIGFMNVVFILSILLSFPSAVKAFNTAVFRWKVYSLRTKSGSVRVFCLCFQFEALIKIGKCIPFHAT